MQMVDGMSSSGFPEHYNPNQMRLISFYYFNFLLLVGGNQEHPCDSHPAHLRSPWNHDQHSMEENTIDFFAVKYLGKKIRFLFV